MDCGNSGMSPDFDILQSVAGDASPLETEGSDSDQPADAPSEPALPPHPAAMGNDSPVQGLGGADDSAMPEGVAPAGQSAGLDKGVASGSGGKGWLPQMVLRNKNTKSDSFCMGQPRYAYRLRDFVQIP